MKSIKTLTRGMIVLAVMTVMGMAVSSARAVIAYDGFNHTVGNNLNGKVTATGQTWAAYNSVTSTGTGTDITVTTPGLTYPGLTVTGNSVNLTPNTTASASNGGNNNDRFNVPTVISTAGTSFFYSMLLNIPTPTNGFTGSNTVIAGFSPGGAGGGLANYGAGLYIRQDPGNSGEFDLAVGDWNQALTLSSWTSGYGYGTTLLVAGGDLFGAAPGGKDLFDLWVDPAFGQTSAPSPTESVFGANINNAGDGPGGNHIGSFALIQGNDLPNSVIADEVRVDGSWANVVIPEPTSAALLLGCGVLLLRRRRLV